MNFEHQLKQLADRYRRQGYKVTVQPGPDVLPPFAKNFHVEIMATRADGNVLASAKGTSSEMEADTSLSNYAEVIGNQPGWRYDLFVLGRDQMEVPEKRDVTDRSEEEIGRSLDDAERILEAGFVGQSVIAAWAALESAMRQNLRAKGSDAGWGTSPRTMLNELVSSGALSTSEFRDLEGLFQLRNVIVHGFSTPMIEPSAVTFLVGAARRLLDESHPVRQAV